MRRFGLALLLALTAGCASYSSKRQPLVAQVGRGDYEAAEHTVQKISKKPPTLLDLMDQGTVAHLQERYADSNLTFAAAERKIDDLFAISVSREVATYMVNDLTQEYSGEEYERLWVNMMMAFNYLGLGQLEEALVEARKIDRKLQNYSTTYRGDWKFKNYAFAHYLSGLLHEAFDDDNDARVAFLKALQGYADYERYYQVATPQALREDLLCVTKRLGITEEYERFRKDFALPGCSRLRNQREIVVLVALGKVAHKVERYWGAEAGLGPVLKVAYPVYVNTPYRVRGASVELSGKTYPGIAVENLSRIAQRTLADRMGLVAGKATSRALLRAGAAAAAGVAVAKETNDPALGALTAIFTNTLLGYTDRADTRSWLTLPAQVDLVRVPLDESQISGDGVVNLAVRYETEGGQVTYTEPMQVRIGSARKTFVVVRSKEAD